MNSLRYPIQLQTLFLPSVDGTSCTSSTPGAPPKPIDCWGEIMGSVSQDDVRYTDVLIIESDCFLRYAAVQNPGRRRLTKACVRVIGSSSQTHLLPRLSKTKRLDATCRGPGPSAQLLQGMSKRTDQERIFRKAFKNLRSPIFDKHQKTQKTPL